MMIMQGAAVGDVNGDGIADILVGFSGNASGLGLFLGNGDGTFQSIRSVSQLPNNSAGLAIGDVNGDGLTDVVAISDFASSIASILLGHGDGTFGTPISITVSSNPLAIALADFNGDLSLDMVTANQGDASISVLLNNYPDAIRVSPSAGGGISQRFAFTFSDPKGPAAIVSAQIDVSATLATTGACLVSYVHGANSIYLADDQGAFHSPLTIGTAGTSANSQCAINAGTSSVETSGKLLTLNLALTFQPAFDGAKNLYMEVTDGSFDTGWIRRGTWNVGTNLVEDFSVVMTPPTQTVVAGASATYIVTTASLNGFNSLVGFQAAGLPSGATASFTPLSVTGSGSSILTIQTSAGTALGNATIIATGVSSSLNHHSSASLDITANNGPPAPVNATTPGTTAYSGLFSFWFYNPGGVAAIVSGQIDLNTTQATVGACYVSFSPNANTLSLANDAGTLQAPLTLRSAGTSENSQCIVDAGASSMTTFGNTVYLNLFVTLKPVFAGSKNIYMKVFNGVQDSGWQQMGSWIVGGFPAPDFTVVTTPASQTIPPGSSTSYTITVTSLNGFNGPVTFTVFALPKGAMASLNPPSVVGSGTSTLSNLCNCEQVAIDEPVMHIRMF